MIGVAGAIGTILLVILIGSLCESFVAWLTQYITPAEILFSIAFVFALVFFLGPIMEAAETGFAMISQFGVGL